jgi:DNA-binding NarL/FixJ family response regulator
MTVSESLVDVVVVDDNDLIGHSVKRWLSDCAGYRFLGSYKTAEAAMLSFKSVQPTVVIMDVNIPGSDPFKALRQMSAHYPHIRVVMLSGHPESRHVAKALDCGAVGYIVKDEGMPHIMDLIRRAVEGEVVLSQTAKDSLARSG